MEIHNIGIIGMGQMGRGIAEVCALSGYKVLVTDSNLDTLNVSKSLVLADLKKLEKKKKIETHNINNALDQIILSQDLSEFKDCDLIIEASTEQEQTKKKIFSELNGVIKDNTILATNTSSISVTRLASGTNKPENFMGLHFMNPVFLNIVENLKFI